MIGSIKRGKQTKQHDRSRARHLPCHGPERPRLSMLASSAPQSLPLPWEKERRTQRPARPQPLRHPPGCRELWTISGGRFKKQVLPHSIVDNHSRLQNNSKTFYAFRATNSAVQRYSCTIAAERVWPGTNYAGRYQPHDASRQTRDQAGAHADK